MRDDRQRLNRRELLRTFGYAPLAFRAAPLYGLFSHVATGGDATTAGTGLVESRYLPHYPIRSPLEDVLRLVQPGTDAYVTELYAQEIGTVLRRWTRILMAGELSGLRDDLETAVEGCSFEPVQQTALRSGSGIDSFHRVVSAATLPGADRLLAGLRAWIGAEARVRSAELEVTSLQVTGSAPLRVRTEIRYSVVAQAGRAREQRVGSWLLEWRQTAAADGARWKVTLWRADAETRSVSTGPGFEDVTHLALGGTGSYDKQLRRGADYWRTVLDGACGMDVYGNNGVAAGDFDGDGRDDLYVCQPAGLPNRLYRNRGDGTFEDVTERAGVGVLDNTACALFADLRNVGLQDLVVVCGTGPLLFLNQGDGTFRRKQDAFQFAQAPQGTFTHAAIADYDRDGRLDLYFCVYSYYLGLDQYHYPAPYYDARNGPPNYLFHNEGDGRFSDRTRAAGLSVDNDRYSFACAWGAAGAGGFDDLYVVNDFGRNNLYRNNGDGTFRSTATASHVEDVGAGMSACWTDYNNDGRLDLYVANMWSAAGQRVSEQPQFHEHAPESIRGLYKQHARGNALYRNLGDGVFASAGERAGVEVGRWAWGSDAWDFDHDGYPDLYVANGYITAPEHAALATDAASRGKGEPATVAPSQDLGSFFWRQVVGNSPEDATPSLAYERGWNALNELIRSDGSWSGLERNAMFANNRDGTFSEVSGVVGMDFLEDGRSFALADLDGDGRLEVILKNRNAPQLRILHNSMEELGHAIAFRLRGTKSNRDAIGTRITVTVGSLVQTRALSAGSGFLSQHSKELFFGVGAAKEPIHATVSWPSGLTQEFKDLPVDTRISLTEGTAGFAAKPFASNGPYAHISPTGEPAAEQLPAGASIATWLIQPLRAPEFTLPDLAGKPQEFPVKGSGFTLLHLWASRTPSWLQQLRQLRTLPAARVAVLAVNLDAEDARGPVLDDARRAQLPYPVLLATEEAGGVYNLIFRYLYDRRRDLACPTSFLLDRDGLIVRVYQGPIAANEILNDVAQCPTTYAERLKMALPFPGTLYDGSFARNEFTYGVAMFQHGYYLQAESSFEEVVASRPNDAEGYYNLGTLNLRRNNYRKAREYLEKTLALKPNYPEAWNNLGMMAAQEGRSADAIQAFQHSLDLRPNYATALVNLGNVYRRSHDFAEAAKYLQRAQSLQPDDPEIDYSLGMLAAQQSDSGAAIADLLRAISRRPDYAEARNNLGVLYIREQAYDKAREQFDECIRLNPRFEETYLNLARLDLAQHDKGGARATLQALLRINPQSTVGKKGLEALDAMP